MVKSYNIVLKIHNHTSFEMIHYDTWFDSGRVADGFKWTKKIGPNDHAKTLCYERNWSFLGCSGWVQYRMNETVVTIGFSNPRVGYNKLGIGTNGEG